MIYAMFLSLVSALLWLLDLHWPSILTGVVALLVLVARLEDR